MDRKVLKLFGHVDLMRNERMNKKVYKSELFVARGLKGGPPLGGIEE